MRKCLTWSFSLFLPSGIENITVVITCSLFLSIKQEKCKWRMLKGQLLIPHLLHHAELLKPSKLWAALICNKHSDKKIKCYISMKYNRLHKYDRTLTRTIYNFREWIKLNRLLLVTTLFYNSFRWFCKLSASDYNSSPIQLPYTADCHTELPTSDLNWVKIGLLWSEMFVGLPRSARWKTPGGLTTTAWPRALPFRELQPTQLNESGQSEGRQARWVPWELRGLGEAFKGSAEFRRVSGNH